MLEFLFQSGNPVMVIAGLHRYCQDEAHSRLDLVRQHNVLGPLCFTLPVLLGAQ